MDRWPFLAGAATGILGIVLLRLRGGDAPVETFQLTLRPIVDSILMFPMDAFETVRLPHADAAY